MTKRGLAMTGTDLQHRSLAEPELLAMAFVSPREITSESCSYLETDSRFRFISSVDPKFSPGNY